MNNMNVQRDAVLVACHVVKSFHLGGRKIPVLRDVSLSIGYGQSVCVRGASGAGKSTLLHILGGLERPTSGKVLCVGEDVYLMREPQRAVMRSRTVGFVFQSYHLLQELTVRENVLLPTRRMGSRDAELRVQNLLERVGLSHRAQHRPSECSGGELQRAVLARALVHDPPIVLADEPTGNLDVHTGDQVLDLLFSLVEEKSRTLVLVTHDDKVAERCGRQLNLVDGCLDS